MKYSRSDTPSRSNELRDQLRTFFVNGGKGTNEEIAVALQATKYEVRFAVHHLRKEGMEIIKTFPTPYSRLTVYSYAPGTREGLYPVRGRPYLPFDPAKRVQVCPWY